jgi:hypothetical protein
MADEEASPASQHTVYAEFFGAGAGIMLNYDYRWKDWLSVRGGAGYSFSTGIGSGEYLNGVASVHGMYALSRNYDLELSPGLAALSELDGDRSATVLSLLGGLRYQRDAGGVFWRIQAGLASFNRSDRDAKTIPIAGLSLGWGL